MDEKSRDEVRREGSEFGGWVEQVGAYDSLDAVERDIEGEVSGVPAKLKPGPKDLAGGVALPLPESDLTGELSVHLKIDGLGRRV